MTGPSVAEPALQVVAAVNDEAILANNLMRSPLVASGRASVHCYRGAASASAAYNKGLDDTSAPIIVFAHQDVFLPDGWEQQLAKAIAGIAAQDPDWAVIGAFGVDLAGRHVGHVWSSGLNRRLGGRFAPPVETLCIDELVIVLRRASNLRFDPALPGFHLYGTDIVLAARAAGLKSYVADIAAIHNSRPVRTYRGGYASAWRYMQRKWQAVLPSPTLTVPLSRSPVPLMRAQFRLWRTLRRRLGRAGDPQVDPRDLVRQLDP
jgi:hypothetical protein